MSPHPPAVDLLGRLSASLEANACEVHLVAPGSELAPTVARLAADHAGGAPVALGEAGGDRTDPTDPPEAGIAGGLTAALAEVGSEVLTAGYPGWEVLLRKARMGITTADVAAAAEGVVGLRSGPGLPRATSLVPPVHLCVVPASVVEPDLGSALRRVAADGMPSALTWIGGPSRTGDLEMRTVMGVHGPLRVVVVIAAGR